MILEIKKTNKNLNFIFNIKNKKFNGQNNKYTSCKY